MFGYEHLLFVFSPLIDNLGFEFLFISSAIYLSGGGVGGDVTNVTKMVIFKGKKCLQCYITSVMKTTFIR